MFFSLLLLFLTCLNLPAWQLPPYDERPTLNNLYPKPRSCFSERRSWNSNIEAISRAPMILEDSGPITPRLGAGTSSKDHQKFPKCKINFCKRPLLAVTDKLLPVCLYNQALTLGEFTVYGTSLPLTRLCWAMQ